MPFEPLGTDEPIKGSNYPRPPKSFENQLVGGCTTILGGSLLTFLLTWWPFLAFPANTTAGLMQCLTFAGVPVVIAGAILTRFFDLAGAIAFGGGLFVGSVFLYLNLNLEVIGIKDPNLAQPEYPAEWQWIIPLIWLLVGITVVILAYRNPVKNN